MSHRKEQAESVLTRAISEVLSRDLSDPRIMGLVSITRVDLSPDHRYAKVYVSIMPDKYEARTIAGLQAAAGHIFARVRPKVAMRTVPKLQFLLDKGLKKEAEILHLINQANQPRADPDDASPASAQDSPPPDDAGDGAR